MPMYNRFKTLYILYILVVHQRNTAPWISTALKLRNRTKYIIWISISLLSPSLSNSNQTENQYQLKSKQNACLKFK